MQNAERKRFELLRRISATIAFPRRAHRPLGHLSKLAEDVGFGPTRRGQPDRSAFKTAAIDLSANLPEMVPQQGFEP